MQRWQVASQRLSVLRLRWQSIYFAWSSFGQGNPSTVSKWSRLPCHPLSVKKGRSVLSLVSLESLHAWYLFDDCSCTNGEPDQSCPHTVPDLLHWMKWTLDDLHETFVFTWYCCPVLWPVTSSVAISMGQSCSLLLHTGGCQGQCRLLVWSLLRQGRLWDSLVVEGSDWVWWNGLFELIQGL